MMMTEYRQAVLSAIDHGQGTYGWYQIERRLSNQYIEVREHLPTVLEEFTKSGWVSERLDDEHRRYTLTDAGRRQLESPASEDG